MKKANQKTNKIHPVRSKPPQAAAALPLAGRASNGVHFIGIGGIGVSALAKYYLLKGWQVSGSDLVSSEITESLKMLGVKIFIGPHKSKNLTNYPRGEKVKLEKVIYSPAVPTDNSELKRAKKLGIKCLSCPEELGELTKTYFTIAVSGTHGKSTTTAMIGLLLTKAGFDPTVIVGTKLKEFGDSNCRVGKSQYLVIEADEHFASFLKYWPKIIVLTRLEADHLDYFKNLKNYIAAFKKFISHLPKEGVLVSNKDDINIKKIIFNFQFSIFKQIPNSKFQILKYSLEQVEARKLRKVLKIPGEHNASNALAALAAARVLKIPDKISFKALSGYRGSWRRFEKKTIKLNAKRLTLISDYGHHPTEIRVTLQAVREKYPKKKIWCVYQPHQHQRTYYLFKDFVRVFREALSKKFAWAHSHCRSPRGEGALFACDKIIITDIYDVAGRENKKIKKKVNSEKLIKVIKKPNAIYLPKEKIIDYLKKNLQGGEVVIIMGAGDIYDLTLKLVKNSRP